MVKVFFYTVPLSKTPMVWMKHDSCDPYPVSYT